MKDNPQLQHVDLPIWLAVKIKFEGLWASNTPCKPSAIRPRDQDDPHDDAHSEGEIILKRQKMYEHGTYVLSSSGQVNESKPGPSTSEMSHIVDEAKLHEVVNEMLRQRCTSGDEHQYNIDQMQNFLKNDIVWESKKRDFIFTISIKANSSRSKLPKISQSSCTISEIIARRTNGSIVSINESDYKNLNKNDIEDLYLLIVNNKVDNYAETGLLWSLSVFIRILVIWERIHDFHLSVKSYQQKVNHTAPTTTFLGIEKYNMFSIVFELVYGIIYKNNKKEKRVMRHQEVHKLCDATLKRVLERLRSYINNVKHGYVTPDLSKEDVEYLQLFEEETSERFKHRDQMRR
nr:hypothetical protein [Tanacetum cinerariifolium]